MPSPTDNTWPTSATSASLPKLAICCFRIAEISAARISISIPLPDRLHRQLQPVQPALQRAVDHPRADLDDHAAEEARIDPQIDRNPPPDRAAQLLGERILLALAQRLRRRDLGRDLAAPLGQLLEKRLDHCRRRAEPPVAGDDAEAIAG